MDEQKIIDIKVQVDKTNVDTSFDKIEKQAIPCPIMYLSQPTRQGSLLII